MVTLRELEAQALELPEADRAILAAHLLRSLPAVLDDEDEGVREALRRDEELDRDPSMGMTLEELRRHFGR